jgi:Flp pilus assembly protein TadD
LERAVELDAGEPEINDHLGDAYWRVGRLEEARFQWRRVLTLEPDGKLKAAAETKLRDGLAPASPLQAKPA